MATASVMIGRGATFGTPTSNRDLTPYLSTGFTLLAMMQTEESHVDSRRLTIGQVATHAGVGVETIRFYERRGLLESPPRSPSGYRQFPARAITRIRFIRRAQELGFSLREVAELLALQIDESGSSAEVKRHAEAKIDDIARKIEDLTRMRQALEELTSCCRGSGPSTECPILAALEDHGDPLS